MELQDIFLIQLFSLRHPFPHGLLVILALFLRNTPVRSIWVYPPPSSTAETAGKDAASQRTAIQSTQTFTCSSEGTFPFEDWPFDETAPLQNLKVTPHDYTCSRFLR